MKEDQELTMMRGFVALTVNTNTTANGLVSSVNWLFLF